MDDLTTLKASAYDLLAQMEAHAREAEKYKRMLGNINERILQVMAKEQEPTAKKEE